MKPKDLVGIPWRVAFALQADGWYLRSDIIWHKPNPMPESVRDRPTKSHEYLFLLTKSARYFFDAEAVRENQNAAPDRRLRASTFKKAQLIGHALSSASHVETIGRNLRSVWMIATQSFKGAHFATFPRKLVSPCIKAGTSERGCCPKCGKGWERETEEPAAYAAWKARVKAKGYTFVTGKKRESGDFEKTPEHNAPCSPTITVGWSPGCSCGLDPVPCKVLDPFAGSGTTGAEAVTLGRSFVGIDLSAEYLKLAKRRIAEARKAALLTHPSSLIPRPC